MTAGVLARQAPATSGLRPIDPRRDMAQVADLIEVAFRGDLDPMGRRMVREMRAMGRAGWIGWALSRVLLPPAARPQGFVWEQDGRVVGNAGVLPVRGFPERWVLANVAVSPEYRRRGIGRQMVEAAIDHARQGGGESLYLQVGQDNGPARYLYEALGFQTLTTRTSWRRHAGQPGEPVSPPVPSEAEGPAPPALHPERQTSASSVEPRRTSAVEGSAVEGSAVEGRVQIRPRQRGEWSRQWELAGQAFPDGLVWPYPLDPGFFRGARVSGRHDWLAWNGDRPIGSLTTRAALRQAQGAALRQAQGAAVRMVVLAAPDAQGEIERDLVAYGLIAMRRKKTTIVIDYLADVADQALKELGFREERTLAWMRRDLKE